MKKGGSECLNLLNLLLVDDNNSVLSSARNGNNLKIRWCVVKCYSWMRSTQVLIEQSKGYLKLPFVLQSVCQQLARAPTRRLPIRWSAEDCFPFPKHRRFRPQPEHRNNNYTQLDPTNLDRKRVTFQFQQKRFSYQSLLSSKLSFLAECPFLQLLVDRNRRIRSWIHHLDKVC